VKRLLILFLLVLLAIPISAHAQSSMLHPTLGDGPYLSALEIDLWPEYDRPIVLVIYHATLSSDVPLPVQIVFRIPAAVSQPNAVAVGPALGTVGSIQYNQQVSSDGVWNEISFTATMPVIQFEYYDPALQKQGTTHHFEYQWPGDYAVQALTIEVQKPMDATDMLISPAMGTGASREDGLTYYHSDVGSLKTGQTFSLSLDYQKASDKLSVENQQVQPSAPINSQTQGSVDINKYLPWVLGGLGLLLIVGGVVWYWQSGRGVPLVKGSNSPQNQRRRKSIRRAPEETTAGEGVYCHQCGKRASPGDLFCRSCGVRLRVE